MGISFSPSESAFYDLEYNYGEKLPNDLVDVTDETHQSFLVSPPAGKKLGSMNNQPAWVDDIPSQTEQEATERDWAQNQLRRTDFIILSDSPYTDNERQKVRTYRAALRNPTRTSTNAFPDTSWRPVWPEGVKLPG